MYIHVRSNHLFVCVWVSVIVERGRGREGREGREREGGERGREGGTDRGVKVHIHV